MSDIIFGASPDGQNDKMTIQCATMWSQAHDFILDSPLRRKAGQVTGFRRALVHDQADGLTVNFNHDYPGGVTLNGPVVLTGDLTMNIHTQTISAKPVGLGGGGGGVRVTSESVNLGTLLGTLRSEIANLEARVAKLEAK